MAVVTIIVITYYTIKVINAMTDTLPEKRQNYMIVTDNISGDLVKRKLVLCVYILLYLKIQTNSDSPYIHWPLLMHLIIIVCCIIKIVFCAINNNTEIINNYIVNTISANYYKHPVRLFNYVFPRGL